MRGCTVYGSWSTMHVCKSLALSAMQIVGQCTYREETASELAERRQGGEGRGVSLQELMHILYTCMCVFNSMSQP